MVWARAVGRETEAGSRGWEMRCLLNCLSYHNPHVVLLLRGSRAVSERRALRRGSPDGAR